MTVKFSALVNAVKVRIEGIKNANGETDGFGAVPSFEAFVENVYEMIDEAFLLDASDDNPLGELIRAKYPTSLKAFVGTSEVNFDDTGFYPDPQEGLVCEGNFDLGETYIEVYYSATENAFYVLDLNDGVNIIIAIANEKEIAAYEEFSKEDAAKLSAIFADTVGVTKSALELATETVEADLEGKTTLVYSEVGDEKISVVKREAEGAINSYF